MIINIGHPRDSQELEKALSATLGEVFDHVAREPIQSLNSLVIASDSQLSAEALREAPVAQELQPLAAQCAGRLADALPGGRVFTDDKAPVEWLIDASIVSVRRGGDRMSAAAIPRREAWGFAEVVVFVAGISTLGAEIAAARLVAPAFGASTVVWANTIAVVLVALAIGYAVGGRFADRHPHARGLALAALLGAALIALIPLLAIPLLGATEDSLGEFSGSLVAQLVLVLPPVIVLGALSPWAIRLRMKSVYAAGDVTGRLYALGTAGGLVGNFAATLALIPLVGTRWTFLLCAALLAAVSGPVAWFSRPA